MSGKLTLISSATASGASSVEFTSGIDSTYDEYVFYGVDIKQASTSSNFGFNASSDGGSNYNVVKTTTVFMDVNYEDASSYWLDYYPQKDLAQSTADQGITISNDSGSDACVVFQMSLYSPSSTSKVKHFTARGLAHSTHPSSFNLFVSGYLNTTSAVDAVKFLPTTSTFSGNIYLFGVS